MIQHNPPLPNTYWIDIVSVCNLKCPMCPQAYGTMGRNSFMSLECFKRLVDDVSKTKPLIKLYMSGESMLHPNLFEMIEYVNEVGCTSMLHTNGTLLNKDKSVKLINSSLNYLSFSFDGSNSEVYEKMRTPAKFDDVKSKILEYFKLKKDKGPYTSVEIIKMKDTEESIGDFISLWKDSGADSIDVVRCMTWLGDVDDMRVEIPVVEDDEPYCVRPFQFGNILSDGTAVPCCMDVRGHLPLGNINENTFEEIWYGKKYRDLREEMLNKKISKNSICYECKDRYSGDRYIKNLKT